MCTRESGFVNHAPVMFPTRFVPKAFSRAAAAACRPEPEAARKGTGMRVLLIEDDSATAQSIELMLKSESFNVYATDLGEEGVDLGKLYDYDIILLDLNLPDMSGFEVLRTLRVSKVKTPILILSGLAGIEDKVRGSRLRRRRLHDQAVPQGRAGGAHPRHRAPLQGPCPVGHPDRRPGRQSRHQDGRGQWRPRAPHRQGVPDAGAALAPQGHHA